MMGLRWIQSPCKGCNDRHLKCHADCERFLAYREKYQAERDRLFQEDNMDKIIKNLNYRSANKHEKVALPLKHGRKPKR